MNKTITVGLVAAVVCGLGGYLIGGMHTTTGASGAPSVQGGGGGFAGRNGGTGAARFAGGGATMGTIIAKDATSITVELRAFGSTTPSTTGTKIVLYDPSTQIMKTSSGSANDLSVGDNVTVSGTSNSDGSVTATMIQLRPTNLTRPSGQ